MSKISATTPNTFETYGKSSVRELETYILYVDLNSCFASVEQQARPKLRNHPVAITNRLVEHSTIIAASVEAKAQGVKVGMRIEEAETICPGIIAAETEPDKYIYVHKLLKNILSDYSSNIVMKSIDEGLIDLHDSPAEVIDKPIAELANEIKTRIREEIGSYMRCNIGFGKNRFYGKLAAELHKPDGADVIIEENSREVMKNLQLTNLPGINKRMEHRLNSFQIFTPLELLDAESDTLEKLVFRSIVGKQWYEKLRGKEVDDYSDATKTVGRQFVIPPETDEKTIEIYLAHLCEDVGARLRSHKLFARGLQIARVNDHGFLDNESPKSRQKITQLYEVPFNSDIEIIDHALKLYEKLPKTGRILMVTLYKLQPGPANQLSVFEDDLKHQQKIAELTDNINNRFGPRTIHSALTTGSEEVRCKIPFGSTKYFGK
ncbi:MAG: hypothetical protein Q4E47_01995 [Candidatus Saccharibacteria bacterium]|nr:hypothetical protein [Candidatus Saccharibacteria bacterium]